MKKRIRTTVNRLTQSMAAIAVSLLAIQGVAQRNTTQPEPAARIMGSLASSARTRLHGTLNPMVRSSSDTGAVPASTALHGISMVFNRSDVQKADLKALEKAQQDPASPLYHQWLTPEQFAARFGMAQADLDKASAWLESQGFAVERVARSRDRIYFSGTVAQVNGAFSTTLHYYSVDGERHFAPSTELSLPASLAGVVLNIGNLDDFKPQAMHHKVEPVKPDFTSGVSGNHFVAPGDVATIYNVQPAYQAGWTGRGQSIAIVGQSDVNLDDVARFQSAAGLTLKAPQKVLVPSTGNGGDFYQGDQAESDLDLEWSGAVAPDATIYFVYTGDGGNAGVFDSIVYAVETRLSPIISVSYGACEIAIGSPANAQSLEDVFQQGTVQGQTLIAASGDDGASGCFRNQNLSIADRTAFSLGYPASSTYFTGVGGTQFNEGAGTYWNSQPGTDVISSALSYIPEAVWNEDDPNRGLGSSGGGVSILYTKPDWQAGVPGIPNDGMRDSPDIALDSAGGHDGLLFCTSDTYFWQQGQQASCDAGFRDSQTSDVTTGGGTSFAAPMFAGMLALINQQQNSTGQGLINPKLYTLASNPTTYASAFHDIVVGSNRCTTGEPTFCPNGPTGYDAGVGYDLTTGIGTVNLNNLMAAWGTVQLSGSVTSLTLQTQNPTTAAPVVLGIAVAAATGSGTPTGTVTMTVDGETDSTPVTLDGGTATYNATITGSGNHVIVANYSGDATYAASTTSLVVNTQLETTTVIQVSPSMPLADKPNTFTVQVEPTTGTNPPDGSVQMLLDGNIVMYAAPLVKGAASYTGVVHGTGQHTFTALYTGSPTFAESTKTIQFNAVTGTTLAAYAAMGAPAVGVSDAITVHVLAATGTAAPAGTLLAFANGVQVSPAPVLDATGSATFPVTFVSAGLQTVTVSYAGSSDFSSATGSVAVDVQPGATTTVVTPATTTPARGADAAFTIAVASGVSGLVPQGAVQLTVDGTVVAAPLALVNGTATYTTQFDTVGDHTVTAAYTGSADMAGSSGSATVKVPTPAFSLASSQVSVPRDGSGVATITVTPASGYSGVITFTVTGSGMKNTCYSLPDLEVDGSGPVTASLKLTTSATSCGVAKTVASAVATEAPRGTGGLGSGVLALAGLVLCGLARGRRRWRQWMVLVLLIAGAGLAMTGCGGSSSRSTPKGTYALTVTGTDTKTSSMTSSVTVTVQVD